MDTQETMPDTENGQIFHRVCAAVFVIIPGIIAIKAMIELAMIWFQMR